MAPEDAKSGYSAGSASESARTGVQADPGTDIWDASYFGLEWTAQFIANLR